MDDLSGRAADAAPATNSHGRMRARHLLFTSVAALGLFAATPGLAQDDTALSSTQVTMLERLTISATRTQKRVLDVPMTVSVIGSEEIDKRVVRDIQDLVRYEPGVSVTRQTSIVNPWGQLTSFNIRGMGANRVQILVDGGRVQEQITDGSRDFVDPFNMAAVEILRGPNSVLWGADALGGVVLFRTKDPADLLADSDKNWAVEIKSSFDSYDNSFRKQISGAYDFGDAQILVSVGHLSSNEPDLTKADPDGGIWGCTRPSYFRCDALFPAETEIYTGLAKLVWTPNIDHEIKLTGEFTFRDTHVDQIWDSSQALGGYTSTDYPRDLNMDRMRLSVEHDWQVNAPWLDSVNWKFAYSPQSRVTESTNYRTYPARTQRNYALRDYNETFYEADLQLQSSFDLGATNHTLTYGFDGDYTKGDFEGTDIVWRSDRALPTVTERAGFNFPRVETIRADLYLQDEIALFDDRLTITPGVRLATYSIDPTGDPSYPSLPDYTPSKRTSTELLKKLGVTYKIDDTYSVYASYGEGFKMPTSAQLFQSSSDPFSPGTNIIPNPDLQPESVRSYEAGVRGEFENGWFSVSGFYADYSDFILSLQRVEGAPGTTVTSKNVSEVQLWGIEVGAEYEFYENIFATANVSWQKGVQRTTSTAAETAFDGAVPLTAVLGIRYEMPEHGLELEFVSTLAAGPSERSDPEAFKPDGYAVFDAFAKWEPTENVEVNFGVQNILDTRYFPNTISGTFLNSAAANVAYTNPLEQQVAPGRTFKIGTTVKF